jgi:hypothetical protein
VIVLLTVSVTVVAAAQPAAPPAEFVKPAFSVPDKLAGTTVTVFVVVVEVLRVVVGPTEEVA